MARERTICRIPDCDHAVKHKKSGLCGRCYHFLNYWKDKTVTQRMKRVDQIEFWNSRAHAVLVPKKVTGITQAKKKRTA